MTISPTPACRMIRSVVAVLTLTLPATAADTWPQYGGPRGDFRTAIDTDAKPITWSRPFGPGKGQVVSDGTRLYVTSAKPDTGGKSGTELTTALDPATGRTLWEESVSVAMLPKQESFGGDPIQPLATPAVADGIVYTIGFTGLLHARDAATGKGIWQTDLVKDHGAKPVQFGFAASPVIADGRLLVAVGGTNALIAFDPKTGVKKWATEPSEPAYATPVVAPFDGAKTVIVQTRDVLFGFDPADGKTRWSYALPTKGLTNVPTPIAFPDGRLLVSGQGWGGTRMLKVTTKDGKPAVIEVWAQKKVQFFYTNWACDADSVYGFPANAGKRFAAVRLTDGDVISQDVGQTDANVLALGKDLLVIRGDGLLTRGTMTADGIDAVAKGLPNPGRAWTAPTPFGGSLIVRSNLSLAAVPLSTLTADFKAPADSGVTAVEKAFGSGKPKKS